jgi:hypothetical protein
MLLGLTSTTPVMLRPHQKEVVTALKLGHGHEPPQIQGKLHGF